MVQVPIYKEKYHKELEYLAQSDKRNKYIRNLATALNGNTLCLFQLVEKHGKELYELIRDKAKDREVFFVYGGVDAEVQRERVREITEKATILLLLPVMGLSVRALILGTCITLFLLVLANPEIRNLQSIGRGLRIGDSKEVATLYDISDDLTYKEKKTLRLLTFRKE